MKSFINGYVLVTFIHIEIVFIRSDCYAGRSKIMNFLPQIIKSQQ